ncbi:LacI family DNA-binding transcriptional regulator [Fictibacillus iocasae]|uniref:LacI family DNA-binding transcriptional regulator n=1 Tax=Fictibacillus iocasae TaxID=2715437 RepID=A0ABW2NNY2_9BACL
MANIRDIAKAANVSVTTVSRVLNDHPYVSEEKRRAVLETMKVLKYNKNLNAVTLSKGKTQIIGVVLPYIHQPFFSLVLNGIARRASEEGKTIMLFQTNYEEEKEREALEKLKGKQLDGLIFCSRALSQADIQMYGQHGPVVLCEESEHMNCVYMNHYESIVTGVRHLRRRGYERIGLTLNRNSGRNTNERVRALKDSGFHDEDIFYGALNMEDGEEIARELLLLGNDGPDALIITNDTVAAGIYNEFRRRGKKIPDDLALLSYDNQHIAQSLEISSVQLPLLEMGEAAYSLLSIPKHKKIELPFTLIQREST